MQKRKEHVSTEFAYDNVAFQAVTHVHRPHAMFPNRLSWSFQIAILVDLYVISAINSFYARSTFHIATLYFNGQVTSL